MCSGIFGSLDFMCQNRGFFFFNLKYAYLQEAVVDVCTTGF